jgi:hypothetical protein
LRDPKFHSWIKPTIRVTIKILEMIIQVNASIINEERGRGKIMAISTSKIKKIMVII